MIDPTKKVFQELATVDFNPDIVKTALQDMWCQGAVTGLFVGGAAIGLAELIYLGIRKLADKKEREV